jgi:hypothetical protein
LGFGICPSFKGHNLSRRAKPQRYDSQRFQVGETVVRHGVHIVGATDLTSRMAFQVRRFEWSTYRSDTVKLIARPVV